MTGGLAERTAIFPGPIDHSSPEEDPLSTLVNALDDLNISGCPSEPHLTPHDNPRTNLLALPAELRCAIYTEALSDSDDGLPLLQVCHRINMEASSILYLRPVSFPSQSKLFAWIERSRENDLKRVRTLTLRLTDIDLSPLLDPTASRPSGGQSAWSLYQQELERLDGALRCLPGIEQLSIIPPKRMQSSLLKGIYLSFLNQLSLRCPKLKYLTIHDKADVLQKVPSLSTISKVIFAEPTPSPSAGRSPTDQDKLPSGRGKAREVSVKMEIDDDDVWSGGE